MSTTGPIRIETPLAEGALVLQSMTATESLGQPFEYTLRLVSEDPTLDPSKVLGLPMTVYLELIGGERAFNGLVTEFGLVGADGDHSFYRAILRPWLWFLSRTADCRIFQDLTTIEVIETILREHEFTDYSKSLSKSFQKREFVVQYRETDLNFVNRLLQEEGVYYFFRQEAKKHVLVLCDSYSAHDSVPEYEQIPYYPPDAHRDSQIQYVDHWDMMRQIHPGAYVHKAYDFQRPTAPLLTGLSAPNDHALSEFEIFDYPGNYLESSQGDDHARVRIEELQSRYELSHGSSNARGLSVGYLFVLSDFPRTDQNRQYLITHAVYELTAPILGGATRNVPAFRCTFTALDSLRPFRTPRFSQKPLIAGPQTALVVGPKDREIWTDEYGRVKLQFHWDRKGKANEASSCWVRVSQVWAGSHFGAMHIPRTGQEVIVEFLEGDPDRPIVTGRVYNAHNLPPYDLPQNRTQSGIKSQSTEKGAASNFNEIRFEDLKGHEELHFQAEKNHTVLVKNDQSFNVLKNRSTSVGGSDSVSVNGDRSLHVHGNLSVSVDGAGSGPVHSSTSVTGKHKLHATDTIEVDAPTHVLFTCGGSSIRLETDKITITAGGKASIVLTADVVAESNGKSKLSLTADAMLHASGGGGVWLDSDVVAASSGNSQMRLNANASLLSEGVAAVTAPTVNVKGDTKVAVSGSGSDLELTGAGATMSAPKISVAGAGTTEITGAVVKIN